MKKWILPLLIPVVLSAETVVIDGEKGLMWQDIRANKELLYTWDEAKEYCEDLRFYGNEDWWLPSEDQLVTIVDMERPDGKKIRKGFRNFRASPYWTSTTYAFNAPHAWYVNFNDGYSFSAEKQNKFYVRCVRKISQ